MKIFHRYLVAVVLTICVFSAVLYTSCKNKCGSTTCQNGGTCESNTCVCPQGYSGNACQTGWSDVFIGTYTCTRENCVPQVPGSASWQSSITKDATNSGYTVDISNFDNSGISAVANIDSAIGGVSKIEITPATGSGIRATGTYSNGVINLEFTATSGGVVSYTCNMVLKKE